MRYLGQEHALDPRAIHPIPSPPRLEPRNLLAGREVRESEDGPDSGSLPAKAAMTTSRRQMTTATTWALVVIFTLGGAFQAGAAVLCVGADGHVDIEVALEGCCVPSAQARDDSSGGAGVSLGTSCGSCSDIRVDLEPLNKQKHQFSPPERAAVGTLSLGRGCDEPTRARDGRSDHLSRSAAPQSTVVLLI